MPTKNSEGQKSWKDSEAKKLLEKDLISGLIPLNSDDMKPGIVYFQRPEFAEFEYGRFRDRLRDLRRQLIELKARASSDSAAYACDREIYPKTTHNNRGEPRWEGSEAERLLRMDMDHDAHKNVTPKELYRSRQEFYNNYPLTVFRKHIDQEERRRKYFEYRRTRK
jgi:hypothetical protein